MDKIPYISSIQNSIFPIKNKLISEIEIKGRISYNGFQIIHQEVNGFETYFILQKIKSISPNPNPSFFLITNLNRVSLYGKIIKIAKVRSMFPYSEFLQKEVFESNNLDSNGKFNNDPRITPYGKFIRKYWIDELPQIFELLSGKIKLVGIRAMSEHYFSLYSEDYKALYLKTKPGIISPIFDENSSFQQIEEIEKQYLIEYQNAPIKTDFKYLIITFKNILKGIRSK